MNPNHTSGRCSFKCLIAPLLAAGAVLLPGQSGLAAVVISDYVITGGSPEYTANNSDTTGAVLGGTNSPSSTGFTGAWSGTTGWFKISGDSLSLPGYTGNEGGSFRIAPHANGNAARQSSRSFTPASVSADTLWFSTLFKPSTRTFDPGREAMLGFLSASLSGDVRWTGADTKQGFGFGISNYGSNASEVLDPGTGFLTVNYQNGAGVQSAANIASLTKDSTYFILSRLGVNSNEFGIDTLDLWVLPSLPTEDSLGAPTWSLDVDDGVNLLNSADSLDALVFWGAVLNDTGKTGFESPSAGYTYFDAIRMGTEFDDVVPPTVPEPSRMLLLAFALIPALQRRQRKL